MRNERMQGTVAGAHYQLLDNILDQMVLEEEEQKLGSALRVQLLQETKVVVRAQDTRYIYLALRLPERLRDAMVAEGYSVWWIQHPAPPTYAVFLPVEGESRGTYLTRMGYKKYE